MVYVAVVLNDQISAFFEFMSSKIKPSTEAMSHQRTVDIFKMSSYSHFTLQYYYYYILILV